MENTSSSPRPREDAYARSIGADLDDGRYVIGFGLIALAGLFSLLAIAALARAVVAAIGGAA